MPYVRVPFQCIQEVLGGEVKVTCSEIVEIRRNEPLHTLVAYAHTSLCLYRRQRLSTPGARIQPVLGTQNGVNRTASLLLMLLLNSALSLVLLLRASH